MKKIDIIQLVGIYIILTSLSYAFYIVFVAVGANEEIASSLLSWTSTMFAKRWSHLFEQLKAYL